MKEVKDGMEFWMRLEKEHPVSCGMFYGTIIIMIVSLMIISLVALTLQKLILQRYADEYFFLNTRFFVDERISIFGLNLHPIL
ncbi:MAG: hypothetical protein HFF15_01325 [Angelakisella sp.]|jgi:hypothetical protein|nr:hypothetical protein [Angelakisella sp.]